MSNGKDEVALLALVALLLGGTMSAARSIVEQTGSGAKSLTQPFSTAPRATSRYDSSSRTAAESYTHSRMVQQGNFWPLSELSARLRFRSLVRLPDNIDYVIRWLAYPRLLIIGEQGGQPRLLTFDVETHRQRKLAVIPSRPARAFNPGPRCALSPDRRSLLYEPQDMKRELILFDLTSGRSTPIRSERGHAGQLISIAWLPDSRSFLEVRLRGTFGIITTASEHERNKLAEANTLSVRRCDTTGARDEPLLIAAPYVTEVMVPGIDRDRRLTVLVETLRGKWRLLKIGVSPGKTGVFQSSVAFSKDHPEVDDAAISPSTSSIAWVLNGVGPPTRSFRRRLGSEHVSISIDVPGIWLSHDRGRDMKKVGTFPWFGPSENPARLYWLPGSRQISVVRGRLMKIIKVPATDW